MTDLILTDQNFEEEVLKSEVPVLVDFYADWCGPCQMYSPILEEVAKDFFGKLKIGKMDVDKNPQTPAKYGVMGIPNTLLVSKGQVVKQIVGLQTKDSVVNEIKQIIE